MKQPQTWLEISTHWLIKKDLQAADRGQMDDIQICQSRDMDLNEDVKENCSMKTVEGIWFHNKNQD